MADVKVYSTPTCPWCARVKEFLKAHDVEFEDINVQTSREKAMEMFDKTGQLGVPVVEINGKIIIGYNEEAMRKQLGLNVK